MNKRAIIRNYISDRNIYTVPSKTVARMIVRDLPDVFKDIEAVRYDIRRIRHSAGKNFSSTKDKEFAEKFHSYFDADINDYTPFVIPDTITRLGVLNDIHIPYHNQVNLDVAIEYLVEKNINGLLLNGDIIDCYKSSYFLKDPRKRNTNEEFYMLREFLDQMNLLFNCPIYYKLGNHEERIEMSVFREVPELLDFINFESCLEGRDSEGNKIFDLKEYNITIIKDKRKIKYTDNLTILHGHEYRTGMFNPVGVARWLFMRTRANACCGHAHKSDSFAANSIEDKTIGTWAIGCLCDMHPQYMPLNDWQSGLAYIERHGDYFQFDNRKIQKGVLL